MVAFVLGQWEIILLIIVAVILFGSTRLPMLGRSVGSAIVNFRKAIKGEEDESDSRDSGSQPASRGSKHE